MCPCPNSNFYQSVFNSDLCAETDREQYLSETKEKAICRSSFLIRYAPEVQAVICPLQVEPPDKNIPSPIMAESASNTTK